MPHPRTIGDSPEQDHLRVRGLFLKSPETFGPISGATNPFISTQRRGSKPSNFAILLVLLTLKIC